MSRRTAKWHSGVFRALYVPLVRRANVICERRWNAETKTFDYTPSAPRRVTLDSNVYLDFGQGWRKQPLA